MINKLKTYVLGILDDDEKTGIQAMSFVDDPAVGFEFMCFDNVEPIEYKFQADKQIVTGVALLADVPIFRRNEKVGEHYVVFKRELIERMVDKFFRKDKDKSVNLDHNKDLKVDGAYVIESYIKDSKRGIVPMGFENVTDGSWMVTYKITDKDLWKSIVSGNKFKGFSIEGSFDYEYVDAKFQSDLDTSFDAWVDSLID